MLCLFVTLGVIAGIAMAYRKRNGDPAAGTMPGRRHRAGDRL